MHDTLSPSVHGVVDYLSVVIFGLAPTLFEFTGPAAGIAYALAVVHLLMTVVTRFPMGMFDGLPLRAHGVVEVVVSVVLVVLPWIAGFAEPGAQWFFPVMGVVIFAVWALTDYGTPAKAPALGPDASVEGTFPERGEGAGTGGSAGAGGAAGTESTLTGRGHRDGGGGGRASDDSDGQNATR